jgi:hypothetical protein
MLDRFQKCLEMIEAVLQTGANPRPVVMPPVRNCFATGFVKCVQAKNVAAACVAESCKALV